MNKGIGTGIRHIVLSQMQEAPEGPWESAIPRPGHHELPSAIMTSSDFLLAQVGAFESSEDEEGVPNNIPPEIFINTEDEFRLRPRYEATLASLARFPANRTLYKYREIKMWTHQYLFTHQNRLFDQRNRNVALVAADPMGRAFGVRAFHRRQLVALMQQQLLPAEEPESPPLSPSIIPGSRISPPSFVSSSAEDDENDFESHRDATSDDFTTASSSLSDVTRITVVPVLLWRGYY